MNSRLNLTLTLRKFVPSDVGALVSYLNDPFVTRYITDAIPKPYTEDDAYRWLDFCDGNELIRAIELDEQLVGCISATRGDFEYARSAELGYWLGACHWNKGVATLAVEMFCQKLFAQTDLHRLFVSVVSENKGSIRVLEKNGFHQEGLLSQVSYKDGQFFDEYIMAKCR